MPTATDLPLSVLSQPLAWEPVGVPVPGALATARIELHWAVQPIAAAARALIDPAADDSHTSLTWLPRARLLAGGVTRPGLRLSLSVDDLTLVVLDATGEPAGGTLGLAGRTFEEALAWSATALRAPPGTALVRPTYPMPALPGAGGTSFGGDGSSAGAAEARAELGRWFATAHALLGAIAGRTTGAAPVRCWPHHFDIATLLPGPAARAGGSATSEMRTIGMGLSPGDDSYAEPYWYVTPWPYPTAPVLPELPSGGQWHRQAWLGAVLTGTANLAAAATPGGRGTAALGFLQAAIRACEASLRAAAAPPG